MVKLVQIFDEYLTKYKSFIPSIFLALSIIIGGLRTFNAWAVFLIVFWLYIVLFRTDFSIQKSGLWGIFLLWLVISVFGSMEPLNSTFHLTKYVTFISFYVLLKGIDKKSIIIWLITLFLISTVSFLTVIIQSALGLKPIGIIPPNPNYTAGILAASVAGLFAAFFETEEKKLKTFFLILSLFFIFALILINSRGAFLSILVAAYFYLFQKKKFKLTLYLTMIVLFIAAFVPHDIMGMFLKTGDVHSFQRINIWKTALKTIYEFPFLGAGLGCFENAFSILKFPAFDGISFFGHTSLHAHSEILNLAAETGIAGALIFLIAFITCGRSVQKNDSLKNISFIMAITLFVQSLVDVTFFLGTICLIFWGCLAMSESDDTDKSDTKVDALAIKSDKTTKFNRPLVFFICIFIILSLFLKFNHQKWTDCSRFSNNPQTKANCIRKSLAITPRDSSLLLEEIKSAIFSPPNNYAIAFGLVENAILKNPKNPFFYYIESEIYYRIGNFKLASEKAFDAISTEPNFLSPRILLIKIFLNNKNHKSAKHEMNLIQSIIEQSVHAPRTDYNKLLLNLDDEEYNRLRLK